MYSNRFMSPQSTALWKTFCATLVIGFISFWTNTPLGAVRDEGAHWLYGGPTGDTIRALSVDPNAPGTVYAAGNGVYKTTDGGRNWSSVTSGRFNSSVAVDPVNSHKVYTGSGDGLFRSLDEGRVWVRTLLYDGPYDEGYDGEN